MQVSSSGLAASHQVALTLISGCTYPFWSQTPGGFRSTGKSFLGWRCQRFRNWVCASTSCTCPSSPPVPDYYVAANRMLPTGTQAIDTEGVLTRFRFIGRLHVHPVTPSYRHAEMCSPLLYRRSPSARHNAPP